MIQLVYLLCALTSLACAVLLLRGYFRTRVRLLLWSGLCFVGLALNNALLPYIQAIADLGLDRAAAHDSALACGVGPRHGQPSQLVADPQRVEFDPTSE